MSAEGARPYRSLWASVLTQAIRDSCGMGMYAKPHDVSEARAFLRSREALRVAAAAGLDPDAFLERLPTILAPDYRMPRFQNRPGESHKRKARLDPVAPVT